MQLLEFLSVFFTSGSHWKHRYILPSADSAHLTTSCLMTVQSYDSLGKGALQPINTSNYRKMSHCAHVIILGACYIWVCFCFPPQWFWLWGAVCWETRGRLSTLHSGSCDQVEEGFKKPLILSSAQSCFQERCIGGIWGNSDPFEPNCFISPAPHFPHRKIGPVLFSFWRFFLLMDPDGQTDKQNSGPFYIFPWARVGLDNLSDPF